MKRRKSGQKPESIDDLQRELECLNAEIAQARSREVGPVMDRILEMMKNYSISLAELERHRRAGSQGAAKTLRFRDPVTGARWSSGQRSNVKARVASQSARKQADFMQTDGMPPPDPDSAKE